MVLLVTSFSTVIINCPLPVFCCWLLLISQVYTNANTFLVYIQLCLPSDCYSYASFGAECYLNKASCRLGPVLARSTVKCRSARPNITLLFLRQSGPVRPRGDVWLIFGGSIQRWHYTDSLVHLGREKKFHCGWCIPSLLVSPERDTFMFFKKKHPDQLWKFLHSCDIWSLLLIRGSFSCI